jgi:hypothetical protein
MGRITMVLATVRAWTRPGDPMAKGAAAKKARYTNHA